MAGALSLLIEPLHVLCYYLMFFAQNHQLLKGREKRRNYVNLTIAVFCDAICANSNRSVCKTNNIIFPLY